MNFLKHYDKEKFRKRYGRYQKLFFAAFLLFLLGAVLEIVLFGTGGRNAVFFSSSLQVRFLSLFTAEAVFLFFLFFFGVTLYAPCFLFLLSFFRGAVTGYVLSFCLVSERGFLFFLTVFFYLVLSAQGVFSYGSFCTCVALRLYTDKALRFRAEEKRMFGGSLFHSAFFCQTVNLRFLFLYTALFFVSLLFFALLVFLFSFIFCLF